MVSTDKKLSVKSETTKILSKLQKTRQEPYGKATLANLRNSIGRPNNTSAEIWPFLFENLPAEYLGQGTELNAYEKTILTTLQLYALHQQGQAFDVHAIGEEHRYLNMGESLRVLRSTNNHKAIDRRFNSMITSITFEELSHHLRQMVKLLRSNGKEAGIVNYALLSNDLYWFIRGYQENLRLTWSRSFYRTTKKGEENNE